MKLFANDSPMRAITASLIEAPVGMVSTGCAPMLANGHHMKKCRYFGFLFALLFLLPAGGHAAETEGVALAIIYDTSGSMREPVRDTNGQRTAKYIIANRALVSVAHEIEQFRKKENTQRKIDAGVFIFNGTGTKPAIPFGPFSESAIVNWAHEFSNPNGNTPLGNAITTAGQAVLGSSLGRKHILVITDGVNTAGPTPATALAALTRQAQQKGAAVSTHFLAFDIDAKVFEPVKKRGATVVAAADEKQLDTQLQFILQKQILLEDEEPPKKP